MSESFPPPGPPDPTPLAGPLLRTAGLAKTFGGVAANHGVGIDVQPGEIRGVIGPNGAGKSTLCNLLSGVYPPTRGDIWLDGEKVTGLGPKEISRRGLLRSFQIPRLFNHMTVRENLLVPYLARRYGRRLRRERRFGEERADRLLESTTLGRLQHLPAGQLSGGQQALLQVALGFMADGLRCYILDEPFAGINPVIKEAMLDLILEKNRAEGVTFLVVSHEMNVVRQLCRQVTVLAAGQVLAEGTIAEVAADDRVIDAYLGRSWA